MLTYYFNKVYFHFDKMYSEKSVYITSSIAANYVNADVFNILF